MRFLLYNIRYGTGGKPRRLLVDGYLGKTADTLDRITEFIAPLDPDIVGLIEVDAGSFRSSKRNQAQQLAESLGHYHSYRSKYSETGITRFVPVLNKQGNAFISKDTIHEETFHYFKHGVKRLVIELELENLTVFLVHLALSFRVRHQQLGDLYSLVRETKKPHIVAGDFNARWGDDEIRLFRAATGLTSADPHTRPTFPSWNPQRQLDFVLHSPEIRVTRFEVPRVTHSDHLPVLCDFEIEGVPPKATANREKE